jgi:O-acetyl-ADP-ribose deacetylase (regulator of RNase III)
MSSPQRKVYVLRFVRGDILEAPTEALVNTVNTVGVMGKGVALAFKRRFPDNYEFYRQACERGEVEIGRMLVFETGRLQPHYIINFPTKRHWRERSKLVYIEQRLRDLVRKVRDLGIRSIAVPALGCGNGGLDWAQVRLKRSCARMGLPSIRRWSLTFGKRWNKYGDNPKRGGGLKSERRATRCVVHASVTARRTGEILPIPPTLRRRGRAAAL